MLLTVPWPLSVLAGRVDIRKGKPNYTHKPKLTENASLGHMLTRTGVAVTDEIRHGGVIMALTTIPYFLIQIPASFLHGPAEEVAEGEHWWALGAFVVCLVGLVIYMGIQLKFSQEGQDKGKRIAIAKKNLQQGKVSLAGALKANIEDFARIPGTLGEYGSLTQAADAYEKPPPEAADVLKDILWDSFKIYDKDNSGTLEINEIKVFFRDFNENIDDSEIEAFLKKMDSDGDNVINFDEFITLVRIRKINF